MLSAIYPLAKDGVWWTLQGEGALQGEPMAFVRLAGCSVGCPQCDTDYGVAGRVASDRIVREIKAVVPSRFTWPWVWITGGEPMDHDLGPLIRGLRAAGFRIALATAGVRLIPQEWRVDWLSVSPHAADVLQRVGHEVKIVPGLNGLSWEIIEAGLEQWASFPWRFIQPLHGGDVAECVQFVLTHPGWRLTSQAHKAWNVR